MSLITVIINNHNTSDLLKTCVDNLLGIDLDIKVVVSESGSSDGSVEMMKDNFLHNPKVVLIIRDNTGISKGYNAALEYIDSKYILYLGTDAFPTKETLVGLVNYFEDPCNNDVGMATTALVTRDGKLDMDAHRGVLTPWSGFTHFSMLEKFFPRSKLFSQYFLGFEDLSKPHEIGSCISHFMFWRKSVQEEVGKWDEDFFVFGEDLDICFRIRDKGYKIMYLPQWETLHYKGAGIGRRTSKDINNKSQSSNTVKKILSQERTRAMRLYYQKHLQNKYSPALNFIVYLTIDILEIMRKIHTWLLFLFR